MGTSNFPPQHPKLSAKIWIKCNQVLISQSNSKIATISSRDIEMEVYCRSLSGGKSGSFSRLALHAYSVPWGWGFAKTMEGPNDSHKRLSLSLSYGSSRQVDCLMPNTDTPSIKIMASYRSLGFSSHSLMCIAVLARPVHHDHLESRRCRACLSSR